MKRNQRFTGDIARRMIKSGFECRMEEGILFIKKGGKCFEVEIQGTESRWKHRVQFHLQFAFDGMDQVRQEGLLKLASESNNHNGQTTTHLWDDCFSCRFDSVIRNSKDFAHEFEIAARLIGETYNAIENNYPLFQEHFRKEPQRRPIGFIQIRSKENDEQCKSAAQTDCNIVS